MVDFCRPGHKYLMRGNSNVCAMLLYIILVIVGVCFKKKPARSKIAFAWEVGVCARVSMCGCVCVWVCVRVCVCACVYPSSRLLITSGLMWPDIDPIIIIVG